jgi:2,3-bisphosphoglycerate-dependent phosphoglycerate mutase
LTIKHPAEQLVLATHGNLLALILQHFDSTIGFSFWESLTMPDIYQLDCDDGKPVSIQRLWA